MNTPLTKILIVDDEVFLAEYLKDMLKQLGFINIAMAHNIKGAIAKLNDFKPELVLLDIRMESDFAGIELAQTINDIYKIPFIYITAHSDKVILDKAMQTLPAGYITKPFKQIDVYAAIRITKLNITKQEEKYLIFKDGHTDVKLNVNKILLMESDGNYVDIICTDTKYTLRISLDTLMEKLDAEQFLRVHRSYIINVKAIDKLMSNSVIIKTYTIPVSRKHIKELKGKM